MSRHDDGENVMVPLQRIKAETDKAYLVMLEQGDGEEVWLPKSQVAFIDQGEVWIPLWLAEKKGIDYE